MAQSANIVDLIKEILQENNLEDETAGSTSRGDCCSPTPSSYGYGIKNTFPSISSLAQVLLVDIWNICHLAQVW